MSGLIWSFSSLVRAGAHSAALDWMKAALAKQRGVPSLELNVSNCMDLHQMRIIVKHPEQMTRVRTALCPSLHTHKAAYSLPRSARDWHHARHAQLS